MASLPCTVLITGANRGLGLEMVKQMVGAQHPVRKLFACCRNPDGPKSEALQVLANQHSDVITVIRLDVSDPHSIKQSAQHVSSLLGPGGLNLLVNNAGIISHGTLQSTSPEDMQAVFNTNVMVPMHMTKEILPCLKAAAKASGTPGMSCTKAAIINISTALASMVSVKETYDFMTAFSYRVSKAGLNMMTLCSTEEFRKDNILVTLLHPGWVRTDMGGEKAAIDAQESVRGMLHVMESLNEEHNGAFWIIRARLCLGRLSHSCFRNGYL